MKTITMDYEEYKKELFDARGSGQDEYHRKMDKALKVFHNTDCDKLLISYEKYETDKAKQAVFSAMNNGAFF